MAKECFEMYGKQTISSKKELPRRTYEEVKSKWIAYWFRQGEYHVI